MKPTLLALVLALAAGPTMADGQPTCPSTDGQDVLNLCYTMKDGVAWLTFSSQAVENLACQAIQFTMDVGESIEAHDQIAMASMYPKSSLMFAGDPWDFFINSPVAGKLVAVNTALAEDCTDFGSAEFVAKVQPE